MKQFFRGVGIKLAQSIIGLIFILLPSAFLFTFLFSQPASVKTFLKESGLYTTISDTMVTSLSSDGTVVQQGISSTSLAKAVRQVAPPSVVQHKVEIIIDDVYAWLYGEKQEFSLELDLSAETQQIGVIVANDTVALLQQKPVCTPTQLQQFSVNPASLNLSSLSSLPCQPPGINYEDMRQQLISTTSLPQTLQQGETQGSTELLSTTALSNPQSEPQQTRNDMQTIGQAANTVIPAVFRVLVVSFYIGLAAIFFTAAFLWLLLKDVVKFSGSLARSFIVSGVLLLIYGGISLWLMDNSGKLLQTETQTQLQALQASLRPFAQVSITALFMFSVAYIMIGIGLLVLRGHVIHAQTIRAAMKSVSQGQTTHYEVLEPISVPVPQPVAQQQPATQGAIRYNKEHD